MKQQPPSFPFYAADYLSSSRVQRMTLEEQGAYVRLLAYNWDDGYIPKNITELAKLCGVNQKKMVALWEVLRAAFVPLETDPNCLVNPKLEAVRKKQLEYYKTQGVNGSKGAAARWAKERKTDETATTNAIGFATTSPQPRHGGAIDSPLPKNGGAIDSPMAKTCLPIPIPIPIPNSPIPNSTQTQNITRSTDPGRRAIATETLEAVWAAILAKLRPKIENRASFDKFWEPLRLLGFTDKFIHVSCPYDPGDDTEWMAKLILDAAIEANHDRGRKVAIAVLLPDGEA